MASESPSRLTLTQLLHPPTWDLPEWNGPSSQDPSGVADKLGDLDISLALLQRYRNALRPIHRMAPDVLLLVFLDLVDEDSDPMNPMFGMNSWIYLAHVCHHWRAIALACPLLWTRISTKYPEPALTCLERSADAPLSLLVHGHATSEATSRVIGAALPHVARIRQISLPSTFQDADLRGVLTPLLQSPAPILDTLQVYKVKMDNGCFALPTMFDGQTPRLTTLKLRYVFPELGSVTFSHLKCLLIKGKKSKPITMELSHLLHILEACPNLEVLKLAKASLVSSPGGNQTNPIPLENLRLLDISRSSASMVSDLLNHLIIPECAMRLNVWLERAADFTFRFGVSDSLDERHHLRNITRLHIEYTSANDYVVIQGSARSKPFQIVAAIPDNSDMGEMPTIAGPLLLSIVRTLDLSLLEEFTISETYYSRTHLGFTRRRWIEIFERMPLLKTLHIRIDSMTDAGFSRSILATLATPGEVTGRLLCPHLETLTMTNDKTWSSLHCYLLAQERAKHGHPLKRLSMRLPCYENFEDVHDTDLPALRRVVEVVDLDPPILDRPSFPDVPW